MFPIGITASDKLQCYRRWWLNKYLKDGRKIIKLFWCGPPSGVYGNVWYDLDDGTQLVVRCPANTFRPRKSDLEVFDIKEVNDKEA